MKLSNPAEKVVATQLLSKNSTTNDFASTNITTQIHQKTIAKYNHEMRTELFQAKKSDYPFLLL